MRIDPTLYTEGQLEELYQGKANGVDYSLFANPEFNEFQMFELRTALNNGYDISKIAFVKYSDTVMNVLRCAIDNDLDPSLLRCAFTKCKPERMINLFIHIMIETRRVYTINDDY